MGLIRKPRWPGIPRKRHSDPDVNKAFSAISELLSLWRGEKGDSKDRIITVRDLEDADLVRSIQVGGGLSLSPSPTITPPAGADPTIPSAPTGFVVSAGSSKAILSWDANIDNNYSYTEIWRNNVDVLGSALLIATTNASVYADVIEPGDIKYYWIRHVNTSGIVGPYNSASGTSTQAGLILLGGLPVLWVDSSGNTSFDDTVGSIEKIAGTPGWNSGGYSTNSVASGDCFVQATISLINNKDVALGLSSGGFNKTLADMEHALVLYGSANPPEYRVLESNIDRGVVGGDALDGDVLSVAIVGGTVEYRVNSQLVYTSAVSPAYPIETCCCLNQIGAKLDTTRWDRGKPGVNGVLLPGSIADGVITGLQLAKLAVDTAHIADAAIVEAKIGAAEITSALIADSIQSLNYNPTSGLGWKIQTRGGGVGVAEFSQLVVRDNNGNIILQSGGLQGAAIRNTSSFGSSFFPEDDWLWTENAASNNTLTYTTTTGEWVYGGRAALMTSGAVTEIASGTTSGVYLTIPEDVALSFADKVVRVSVLAKQPATNPSAQFAVAYSTADNGNSGWEYFIPTTAWAAHSFTYRVAPPISGGTDFVGIWADTSKNGKGLLVDSVLIEVADNWANLDDPTGTKPADNATVGADWSVNITGQPPDAAILNAQQDWAEVANIPFSYIYNNDDASVYGFNPTFAMWSDPNLPPDGWTTYNTDVYTSQETVEVLTGPHAVRMTMTGADANVGIKRTNAISFKDNPLPAGSFVLGAVTFKLMSLPVTNDAEVMVRLYHTFPYGGSSTYRDTHVAIPDGLELGIWHTENFVARLLPGERIRRMDMWLMGAYGVASEMDIVWDSVRFTFMTSNWDDIQGINKPADNATAGADWLVDVNNIPWQYIYNNDDATVLGFNPTFSDWTGTLPAGYAGQVGAAPTKETANSKVGPNAVRYATTGANAYMDVVKAFNTPMPVGTFIIGTFSYYLNSYTSGDAGLLLRLYYDVATNQFDDTPVVIQDTTIGVWHTQHFVARLTTNPTVNQIEQLRMYVMGSWSGFNGGLSTLDITFDSIHLAFTSSDWQDLINKPANLVQTFYQSNAPTSGFFTGDYWIDSDDNKIHRRSASSWDPIQDTDIGQALLDAQTAQTVADGKINTWFHPPPAPTGMVAPDNTGDLWFDTADNNKVYRWDGTWQPADYDVASWSKIIDDNSNKPADNADVTLDNTAGSGVNILSAEYSAFENSALPPLGTHNNVVASIDTGISMFGSQSLKLVAPQADGYVYLSNNGNTYNVNLTPGRKWILSAYVRCDRASRSAQLYLKRGNDAFHMGASFTTSATPNTWTRISMPVDLTGQPNTTDCVIRLDNDGNTDAVTTTMWFDGIMLEEQVGNLTTPSGYYAAYGTPQSPAWLTDPVVWSGNQITAANISTYISGAAIDSAYIISLAADKISGDVVDIDTSITTERVLSPAGSYSAGVWYPNVSPFWWTAYEFTVASSPYVRDMNISNFGIDGWFDNSDTENDYSAWMEVRMTLNGVQTGTVFAAYGTDYANTSGGPPIVLNIYPTWPKVSLAANTVHTIVISVRVKTVRAFLGLSTSTTGDLTGQITTQLPAGNPVTWVTL